MPITRPQSRVLKCPRRCGSSSWCAERTSNARSALRHTLPHSNRGCCTFTAYTRSFTSPKACATLGRTVSLLFDRLCSVLLPDIICNIPVAMISDQSGHHCCTVWIQLRERFSNSNVVEQHRSARHAGNFSTSKLIRVDLIILSSKCRSCMRKVVCTDRFILHDIRMLENIKCDSARKVRPSIGMLGSVPFASPFVPFASCNP